MTDFFSKLKQQLLEMQQNIKSTTFKAKEMLGDKKKSRKIRSDKKPMSIFKSNVDLADNKVIFKTVSSTINKEIEQFNKITAFQWIRNQIRNRKYQIYNLELNIYVYNHDFKTSDQFQILSNISNSHLQFQIQTCYVIPYGEAENITIQIAQLQNVKFNKKMRDSQYFKDGETNCLLQQIQNVAIYKSQQESSKRQLARYTRTIKITQEFIDQVLQNGVNCEKIQEISTQLRATIIINDILHQNVLKCYPQENRSDQVYTFTNITMNHVQMNELQNNSDIITMSVQEIYDLMYKLSQDNSTYIYTKFHSDINTIQHNGTTYQIYYTQKLRGLINEFKNQKIVHIVSKEIENQEISVYDKYQCETIVDYTISSDIIITLKDVMYNYYSIEQFMYLRQFSTMNTSKKCQPRGLQNRKLYQIDQKNAYTQFKQCDQFMGFPILSDERECPSDWKFSQTNIGFYICSVTKYSKHFNLKICLYEKIAVQRLTSPEILYFHQLGCEISLQSGIYGNKSFEFDFPQYMIDECVDETVEENQSLKMKPFVVLTGQMQIDSENSKQITYLHSQDEYIPNLIENCKIQKWEQFCDNMSKDGNTKFDQEKYKSHIQQDIINEGGQQLHHNNHYRIQNEKQKKRFHSGLAVAMYIVAYTRLNLAKQISVMNPKLVQRIVSDGVYTFESDAQCLETYRYKPVSVQEMQCANQYVLYMNSEVIDSKNKYIANYNSQLSSGTGGSGKTHDCLIDNGKINQLYIAPSNKLMSAKRIEYNNQHQYSNYTLANLPLDTKYIKYYPINIVCDEISMIQGSLLLQLQKRYPFSNFVMCGDECQIQEKIVKEENAIDPFELQYDHIKEYTFSHRCKDEELRKIQDQVRYMRKDKYSESVQVSETEHNFININPEEIQLYYNQETDAILSSRKDRGLELNLHIQTDKFKYIALKKCKINDITYNNGDTFITDNQLDTSAKYKQTDTFTIHQVQGETFKGKLFIDKKNMFCGGLFYTAITRVQYLNQIILIND